METGLKDRVAIVAASSQGLGLATAHALAAEGCNLAMCSRDEKRIQAAADQVRQKHHIEVSGQAVDVTDQDAVKKFVAGVASKFGRIDICVTNSGGPPAKQFADTTPEEWRRATESNFLSVVWFAHEVLPVMQRHRWGRFITITSVSTKQPVPNLVLSNAVRAAVVGLVKSLANEYGKDGILVNNVGPGYTSTERLNELAAANSRGSGKSKEEIFAEWAANTAVKRVGTPEEFGATVVWLASERSSFITGQTILVDGGNYKGL